LDTLSASHPVVQNHSGLTIINALPSPLQKLDF
jgi:hypothetical protein